MSVIGTVRQASLKRKILVSVWPTVILLFALTSYLTFDSIVSEFSTQVDIRVKSRSLHFVETAQSRINEAVNATAAIARNHLVINGIVDIEHRQSTLRPFFRSLVLPGPDDQIATMTDYRGNPLAATNSAFDQQNDLRKFKTEFEKLKSVWADSVLVNGVSFVGTHSGKLVIASPVVYGNRPEGAIVSVYSLETFFSEILEDTKSTVTGIEYRDKMIASANADVLKTEAAFEVPTGWISSKIEIPNLNDVRAVVLESERSVYAASNAIILAITVHFIISSLGILAAIWIAIRMVTLPLANLVRRIKQIQETTDLTLRVENSETSEFDSLSTAFNKMLAELDKTTVSKEMYRTLALVAKYTDNAVVITDAAGKIEWVNHGFTRTTGFELDEVLGESPGKVLQGDETDRETVEQMRKAIKESRGFDVEIINYTKAGAPYWVAIETRPIMNDKGEVEKFIAIETDITDRKRNEAEKANLASELQESARYAGMAEIATGVLHNVGNVLNSINVSASLLIQNHRHSQVNSLFKASKILEQQGDQLGEFLTRDEKGKHFPAYFKLLAESLVKDNKNQLEELSSLAENVNHVKEIVSFQQSYAKQGGVVEPVNLSDAIEGVLKMNADSLANYGITLQRSFETNAVLQVNKHKLLQILINLLTNASHALRDLEKTEKTITIRIFQAGPQVSIAVTDNGIGIPSQNLEKIFAHGFTTKNDGHGFGLHSSALAAQEMQGSLTVDSPGIGHGATFTLSLPNAKPAIPAIVSDETPIAAPNVAN